MQSCISGKNKSSSSNNNNNSDSNMNNDTEASVWTKWKQLRWSEISLATLFFSVSFWSTSLQPTSRSRAFSPSPVPGALMSNLSLKLVQSRRKGWKRVVQMCAVHLFASNSLNQIGPWLGPPLEARFKCTRVEADVGTVGRPGSISSECHHIAIPSSRCRRPLPLLASIRIELIR